MYGSYSLSGCMQLDTATGALSGHIIESEDWRDIQKGFLDKSVTASRGLKDLAEVLRADQRAAEQALPADWGQAAVQPISIQVTSAQAAASKGPDAMLDAMYSKSSKITQYGGD